MSSRYYFLLIFFIVLVAGCTTQENTHNCVDLDDIDSYMDCCLNNLNDTEFCYYDASSLPNTSFFEARSLCDNITENLILRNMCYSSAIVHKSDDPDLCYSLQEFTKGLDEEYLLEEVDGCYQEFAYRYNNYSICLNIKGDTKYNCLNSDEFIVNYSSYNICYLMNSSTYHQYNCLVKVGANIDDPDVCNIIKDLNLARDNACAKDVLFYKAVFRKDPNLCINYSGDLLERNYCLRTIISLLDDPDTSVCDLYPKEINKKYCVRNIIENRAIENEDCDICFNISYSDQRDFCLIGCAKYFEDKGICDKIINEEHKSECISEINEDII